MHIIRDAMFVRPITWKPWFCVTQLFCDVLRYEIEDRNNKLSDQYLFAVDDYAEKVDAFE